jgi:hypothetical protein
MHVTLRVSHAQRELEPRQPLVAEGDGARDRLCARRALRNTHHALSYVVQRSKRDLLSHSMNHENGGRAFSGGMKGCSIRFRVGGRLDRVSGDSQLHCTPIRKR